MRRAAEELPETDPARDPDIKDREVAEDLYRLDFKWFNYPRSNINETKNLEMEDAGTTRWIHQADSLQWHWGPTAIKEQASAVNESRQEAKGSVLKQTEIIPYGKDKQIPNK